MIIRQPADIFIPGFGHASVRHIVCDFSGTLFIDGTLLPGLVDRGLLVREAMTPEAWLKDCRTWKKETTYLPFYPA